MNTTRRWLLLACIIAALLLAAWWFAGPPTTVRLADGTTLRLLGVTTGTNWFSTERPWHRFARRVLPLRYQGVIPPVRAGMWGYQNSATYWFELHDETNGIVRPKWERAETVSNDGDVLGSQKSPQLQSPYIFGIGMDCFPRRDRTFLYRIYGANNTVLGEIRLPSPFPGPFPDWQPDPLPTTRTNGDLTVTLRGVRKFMEVMNRDRTNISFRTDVEFRWHGVPTTNWELGPCFVEDATGNAIGRLHAGLPAAEKVWRWRVWMQRRPDAPFAPEERFVITNLAIPSPGSWTVLNITTNLQGLEFWIGAWVGPSAMTLSNGLPFQIAPPPAGEDWQQLGWGFSSGAFIKTNLLKRPTLLAAVRENGIEIRADVKFRDQDGRLLPRDYDPKAPLALNNMTLRPGGEQVEEHVYRPVLDDKVSSVSVEVTVQRRPEMSFFIAPPSEGEWIGRRPQPPQR